MLAQHGAEPCDWELKRELIGLRDMEWSSKVVAARALEGKVTAAELVHGWHDRLQTLFPSAQALPGAYEMVTALKERGAKLALATSSVTSAVALKRQSHEALFAQFDAIVCGDDPAVLHGKPAPDIFLVAAARVGVAPARCLVVHFSSQMVDGGWLFLFLLCLLRLTFVLLFLADAMFIWCMFTCCWSPG